MVISSSTFISDTVLFIRDLLRTNVTDPLLRTNGIGFVNTAFPKRKTQYPLITVMTTGINSKKLGMQSEKQWTTINLEIQIYSRNAKEVDNITQNVMNTLRTNQFGTSSTDAEEIHELNITSVVPIVEPQGDNLIHRKIITTEYKVIL